MHVLFILFTLAFIKPCGAVDFFIDSTPTFYNGGDNKSNGFPELPCLKEQVDFWQKIYTQYDADQVVVHNRNHLDTIYGVYKPTVPLHIPAGEQWRGQRGLKSAFYAGLKRSSLYKTQVDRALKNWDLPAAVAYLPHVESSYNPHARSKAGAIGLWQIMPQTFQTILGKVSLHWYGDIEFSSHVAAHILKENHRKLGNWPLALTAYNHGTQGILRAVRETGSSDLCRIMDAYKGPKFGFASRNFYAQFLAAKRILEK